MYRIYTYLGENPPRLLSYYRPITPESAGLHFSRHIVPEVDVFYCLVSFSEEKHGLFFEDDAGHTAKRFLGTQSIF
jgi:hypothetical protein